MDRRGITPTGSYVHRTYLDSVRYWGDRGHKHTIEVIDTPRQTGPQGAPKSPADYGFPATLYVAPRDRQQRWMQPAEVGPFVDRTVAHQERKACRRDWLYSALIGLILGSLFVAVYY